MRRNSDVVELVEALERESYSQILGRKECLWLFTDKSTGQERSKHLSLDCATLEELRTYRSPGYTLLLTKDSKVK